MDLDEQPCIWVENKDGKLEKRQVTLGEHDENLFQYQIKSGLKVNDYIAFPQEFLKEGMKTTHEEIPMNDQTTMPAEGEMPEGSEALPQAGDGADAGAPEGEAGAAGTDGETAPGPEGEAQ